MLRRTLRRIELQQCLPFTVLKLYEYYIDQMYKEFQVATVLTVYGIETI